MTNINIFSEKEVMLAKKRVAAKRSIRRFGGGIIPRDNPLSFNLKKLRKLRKKTILDALKEREAAFNAIIRT